MMSTAESTSTVRFLERPYEEREPKQVVFTPGMALSDIERCVILETLKQQKYNRTRAAKVLGIGIRTLQRRLKEYRSDDLLIDIPELNEPLLGHM